MTAPLNVASVQGQGVIPADLANTWVQGASSVAALRGFTGLPGMSVFLFGTTTPGDGGQGNFYWNATSTGPDDNGVTMVVPTGSTAGAWVRLTGS